MQITSGDMPMLSDLQLVYMGPRNSTQLLKINTTKFQVEREPVYIIPMPLDILLFTYEICSIQFSLWSINLVCDPMIDQSIIPNSTCHSWIRSTT